MELWFRYNDPYSNTACGDRNTVHNLVLKVKRMRRKKGKEDGQDGEPEFKYKVEVVGMMSVMYKFTGKSKD